MTHADLPERLRIPGVVIVQPGEKHEFTVILTDEQVESFAEINANLLDRKESA